MNIVRLLNSDSQEDIEVGKIALMHRNESIFLDHVKYVAPWFLLDAIPTSAILGEPYFDSVYYDEALVQEAFPEFVMKIVGKSKLVSENYSDFIEEGESDIYFPSEEINWDDVS